MNFILVAFANPVPVIFTPTSVSNPRICHKHITHAAYSSSHFFSKSNFFSRSESLSHPSPCSLTMSSSIMPQDFAQKWEEIREADTATKQLNELANKGTLKKWNSANLFYRNVSLNELQLVTKLDADALGLSGKGQSFEELKDLFAIVLVSCTVLAFASSALLPGDYSYFVTYAIGGLAIVFLAVGSTAPGLIAPLVNKLTSLTSGQDYQERVLVHEAAHFLAGYLCGVPVKDYEAADIMKVGVQFYELEKLQRDLQDGQIDRPVVDKLSVISLAGIVQEAITFGKAQGGQQDLVQLQGLLFRARPAFRAKEQEQQTRWAAFMAFTILKKNKNALTALVDAMRSKATIDQCIAAIESAEEK